MTEPVEPELGTAALATAKIMGTATPDAETGRTAGAVYRPPASMVPTVAFPPTTPFTLHCTALLDPATEGMNCTLVPRRTVAPVGVMARVTAVLLLLLHPASNRPMTSVAQIDANRTFILLSPMPVAFLARLKAWSSPIQNV